MAEVELSWERFKSAVAELRAEGRKPGLEALMDLTGADGVTIERYLDRLEREDPLADEIPEAFLKQCQDLWQHAMSISGEAYHRMKDDLTAQLEEANRELRTLREQADALVATRDSQARELVAHEKKIAELENTMASEQERHQGLDAQLRDRDSQLEEAGQAISAMEERVRETQAALEAERASRRELAEELSSMRQSHEDLGMSPAELQNALNRTSSKLEVISNERDRLNRDLSDAFETINFTSERVKSLEKELAAAREVLTSQTVQLEAAENRAATMEGELAVLRKKNEILNKECNAFAEKNAELLRRVGNTTQT